MLGIFKVDLYCSSIREILRFSGNYKSIAGMVFPRYIIYLYLRMLCRQAGRDQQTNAYTDYHQE